MSESSSCNVQKKMAVDASCAAVAAVIAFKLNAVDFSGLLYLVFYLILLSHRRHYFPQCHSRFSVFKNTWNVIEAFKRVVTERFSSRMMLVGSKQSTMHTQHSTSALNYIAFLMHWCMHQKAHEKCRNIDSTHTAWWGQNRETNL